MTFATLTKLTRITKVSCFYEFTNAGGATHDELALGTLSGTSFAPKEYLSPLQLINAISGKAKYQLNVTTQTPLAVGVRPAILIGFTKGASPAQAQCTISGTEHGT